MNVSQVLSAAEGHLAQGRDAAAKQLFTEVLEQPAGAVRAMAGLGKLALREGDAETAQQLFGHALTREPENARAAGRPGHSISDHRAPGRGRNLFAAGHAAGPPRCRTRRSA